MTNVAVAQMLAGKLSEGLIHPGDDTTPARVLVLPGFRTVGMPEAMAVEVNDYAKLIAEAIVATIVDDGSAIVPAEELALIRKAMDVAEPPTQQVVRVTCAVCQSFLFSVNVAISQGNLT